MSEYFLLNTDTLPLILAGPMLRHTQADEVTVWLALKTPCLVELRVYPTQNGQNIIFDEVVLSGRAKTIQLGEYLHLVAVTARPLGDNCLQPGIIYAYNVYFDDSEESLINLFQEQWSVSYFSHQLPTFSLPPKDLNDLRLVHGSCRKPHGGGRDTLSLVDDLIRDSADLASLRPHQLFLTGDQIYGDDVADHFLWLAQQVSLVLLGCSEELPLFDGAISNMDVTPGKRTEIARIEGGLTAMISRNPDEAKSHLFSFGEYAAAYLFAWSPVLIPSSFPTGKSLFSGGKKAEEWDKQVLATKSFVSGLSRVRRALANVPTYTICDDHDVTDDWYLNREWCDRVLSKPLGRRIVQNGLLAYALFQAWGNTPQQFEQGTSGGNLLEITETWLLSQGKNQEAEQEILRHLGIPKINQSTGLPEMDQEEGVCVLSQDRDALTWYYTVRSFKHEVIILDTRTRRGYPLGEKAIAPPMLLCPSAFEQQLAIFLEETDRLNQEKKTAIEATIIVLPTNLVALGIIDRIQKWELSRDQVFSSDVGDSWNFHQEAFTKLLLTLCQRRDRVIILSGDIHYSCALRLSQLFYQPTLKSSVLVQLTSSAIKNSEFATRLVHTRLKSLFPEKGDRFLVWQEPLKIVKLSQNTLWKRLFFWKTQENSTRNSFPPNWQYRIEWYKRQAAQSLPWELVENGTKLGFWQRFVSLIFFCFWRNPWIQEGSEVVGRNNISVVRLQWSSNKAVIQETYWHPPWNPDSAVKSTYQLPLDPDVDCINNPHSS